MSVAPHPRHDGQLLYEWLEANFRYFTAGDPQLGDKKRGSVQRSASDRAIGTLQALLDQLDAADHERGAKIAERNRRGKLYRARAGEIVYRLVPYGYRRIPRSPAPQPPGDL